MNRPLCTPARTSSLAALPPHSLSAGPIAIGWAGRGASACRECNSSGRRGGDEDFGPAEGLSLSVSRAAAATNPPPAPRRAEVGSHAATRPRPPPTTKKNSRATPLVHVQKVSQQTVCCCEPLASPFSQLTRSVVQGTVRTSPPASRAMPPSSRIVKSAHSVLAGQPLQPQSNFVGAARERESDDGGIYFIRHFLLVLRRVYVCIYHTHTPRPFVFQKGGWGGGCSGSFFADDGGRAAGFWQTCADAQEAQRPCGPPHHLLLPRIPPA